MRHWLLVVLVGVAVGCGGRDGAPAGRDGGLGGRGGDAAATVDSGSDGASAPDTAPANDGRDDAPADSTVVDAPPPDAPASDGAPSDRGPSDAALDLPAPADGGGDGGQIVGSAQLCSNGGWCWVHPIPTGNDLDAVLARSASDVWTAGWYGTLVHWDGAGWTQFHVASDTAILRGLAAEPAAGATPGAVWVVGDEGLAARFDGQAWTITDTGTTETLKAVWAAGTNQVYAVGDGATALYWDGARWTPTVLMDATRTETRGLLAVWASGSDDVWIGGSAGALWHKQGATWTEPQPGSANSWTAIAGSGASNVWMINDSGRLTRWNGSALVNARDALSDAPNAIWAAADNDVWVARSTNLEHWDGASWSAIQIGSNIMALGGSASDQVWAVGWRGAIARWNGRTFAPHMQSQLPYGVTSAWAAGPRDVWMASQNRVFHWDGTTVAAVPAPVVHPINAIWGSGPTSVWTAGEGGEVMRWNGTQWALAPDTGGGALLAIHGSAASDVWAVGLSTTYHFDGTSWTLKNTGIESTALSTVFAASPTQAWAGGFNDLVVRWNGTRWSAETLPGSMHQVDIQTLAGTGANDVWAFGEQGYHWNGQSWSAVAGAMIAQHAWGSGPNDWWAIVAGVVFHYDGATWRELSPGASSPVAVTGFGTSDVWLGNQGGLLHRIGGAP